MQTQRIRQMITAAVADDNRTGATARLLREFATAMAIQVPEADVTGTATFLREYIEHVPMLIEVAGEAARQVGVEAEFEALLVGAARYWHEPNDAIPDRAGLFGLLDDAYVFLTLIHAMSLNCQQRMGRQLVQMDLTPANTAVRRLIGEPIASQLDGIVAGILQGPSIQAALNQLLALAPRFNTFNTPDPIWGNASIDEIVTARMGALGIV